MAIANYLDFLYELDRYTRDSPLGCVPNGAEMHAIARGAGLAGPADTSAAAWTGRLVHLRYVTPGPALGGAPHTQPPPGPWTDDVLQTFTDYQVTSKGREEADRIHRLRREKATDAALGHVGPILEAPSISEAQRAAIAAPLKRLRTALDHERWVDAVGSAKDLVEAACKVTLAHASQPVPASESLPTLFKRALGAPPPDGPGGELGRSLTAAVQRLAELRNVSGAGHGHAELRAVAPRDARIAATAAVAVCSYLLDTERASHSASRDGKTGLP